MTARLLVVTALCLAVVSPVRAQRSRKDRWVYVMTNLQNLEAFGKLIREKRGE